MKEVKKGGAPTNSVPEIKEIPPPEETTVGAVQPNKFIKVSKVLLPHIALNCGLLVYLLIGAVVFQRIEQKTDDEFMQRKAERIMKQYNRAAEALQRLNPNINQQHPDWKQRLYASLHELSLAHDPQFRQPDPDADVDSTRSRDLMPPRWTLMESMLYALSILTTTGYTYVSPVTGVGQICSIVYGLIGIPLTVLAAVDLGRFMSDCLLYVVKKTKQFFRKIGCCKVQNVQVRLRFRGRSSSSFKRRLHKAATLRGPNAKRKSSRAVKKPEKEEAKRKLPLWMNASILLLFCGLGAIIYMGFESQHNVSFMDAFFASFNLVANLTMAEVKTESLAAVVYIVCFVTFGLAVLTMCAELAASELKWVFMKIHYFGRKIRHRKMQLPDEEVKVLMHIIEQIRKKHPDKTKITEEDLITYVTEERQALERAEERYRQRCRRPTVPYQPTLHELKFVDEGGEGSEQVGLLEKSDGDSDTTTMSEEEEHDADNVFDSDNNGSMSINDVDMADKYARQLSVDDTVEQQDFEGIDDE